MKKVVLVMLGFCALGASAQTFTADDTLSAGDSEFYWTADSSAANLDAITGSGVTWDYSGLEGYNALTNNDTVKWASDSPDYGDYPSAVYHDDLAGGASMYFENYADSVISYGFVFNIDGNTVKVMHDVDPMKTMELPMMLNDTFTDSTYGNADVYGSNAITAGDITVTADGTGTLNLGTATFADVIRIKTVETIETTVTLPPPINTVTGVVTRTEYRYFRLADQNEALLIHATIGVNSTLFNGGYSAVYSSEQLPELGASIDEEYTQTFDVHPNPAADIVTINTENVDQLIVMNALGQTVLVYSEPQNVEKLDVSKFEKGIYFIQVKKGNASKTEKLIVR